MDENNVVIKPNEEENNTSERTEADVMIENAKKPSGTNIWLFIWIGVVIVVIAVLWAMYTGRILIGGKTLRSLLGR